jgi:ubiquinone/menaquinone biosynthesis C-methylase UbiE
MEDPIRSHPTRAEQLDILATVIAEVAGAGDRILDLGCGTGYGAKLILDRRPDLHFTGVDLNSDSLAQARDNLAGHAGQTTWIEGNLEDIEAIAAGDAPFRVILTALTFHDLSDEHKQAVIGWSAARLAPGGFFLLYDRMRLTEGSLFPLQQSIWARIERIHGRGMRTAADFAAYQADLAPNNRPARLFDYFDWFEAAGLSAACLHLHGNVGLIAGARPD